MKLKKEIKRFFTLKHKANNGFTLVELIVVIAILGVLGGVAVPVYSGYVEKANRSADDQLLATINKAYAVACLKNGVDMARLDDAEMPLTGDKIVDLNNVNPYPEDFRAYYEGNYNSEFKYYDALDFVNGIFVGVKGNERKVTFANTWKNNGNSFFNEEDGGEGAARKILEAFDGIGRIFSVGGMDGDVELNEWLPGLSGDLAAALGFDDMIDGINDAMGSVEGQAAKGNEAVMYFAEDAAKRSVEDVQRNVEYFMHVLAGKKADGMTDVTVDDAYVAAYIRSTFTEQDWVDYGDLDDRTLRATAATWPTNGFGLGLSYEHMARMAKAAEEGENTTGISSLGAMYALSAGYYEQPGKQLPPGESLGTFGSVMSAMSNPDFVDYYTTKGTADLDAYLSFMGYLSTGNFDEDMETEDMFAGSGYEYIADALGFGN